LVATKQIISCDSTTVIFHTSQCDFSEKPEYLNAGVKNILPIA